MALPYLQPGSASWPPISDAPERVGQSDDVLAKDRHVPHRAPARAHRVEDPPGLFRRPGPDLDDLIGEKIPKEPGDYLSQQGGLGSGRVVFRQLSDALEEDGPRPVIKVLRRQGL